MQTYREDDQTTNGESLSVRWERHLRQRADELALAYGRGDWDLVDSVVAERETLRNRLDRELVAACP